MPDFEKTVMREGLSSADIKAMWKTADEAAACIKRIKAAVDILEGCRKKLPSCWEGQAFRSFYERYTVAVNTVEQVIVEDYGSCTGTIRVAAKRRGEAHGQAVALASEIEVPVWAEV